MLTLVLPCLLAVMAWPAGATGAAGPAAAALSGSTLDGRRYDLAARRGRVAMVVLWRSNCAVCLNKMPELRANAAGWSAKPFDLVTLNLDAKRDDALAYEDVLRRSGTPRTSTWSLWQGDAQVPADWLRSARLPVLLLIDAQGQVVRRWEGRVPSDAWDEVADLLP